MKSQFAAESVNHHGLAKWKTTEPTTRKTSAMVMNIRHFLNSGRVSHLPSGTATLLITGTQRHL